MAWARFKKKDMPGGLWLKCPSCGETIYKKDLDARMKVCPKCDHHHTLSGMERVRFTLDEGSAVEMVEDMEAVDRLNFEDKTSYPDKLQKTMEKTKRKEAIWIGTGKILGRDVAFGTLDFSFLGGSMGVVVGEKVTILVEYALEHDLPLILVAASGGARMHEGALSLMQMAKTCNSLGRFDQEGRLYISILGNPTTGGVTASWATQADVVLAEPGALIGFAGPRVIKTTLRQDLPEGFQRSEFLIGKGQIDQIVHREKIRQTLFDIMEYCLPSQVQVAGGRPTEAEASSEGASKTVGAVTGDGNSGVVDETIGVAEGDGSAAGIAKGDRAAKTAAGAARSNGTSTEASKGDKSAEEEASNATGTKGNSVKGTAAEVADDKTDGSKGNAPNKADTRKANGVGTKGARNE